MTRQAATPTALALRPSRELAAAFADDAALWALRLAGLFLAARFLMLYGRPLPYSAWTPLACIWQDLLAAACGAVVVRALPWPWLRWTLYGGLAIYVAVNVPLVRVLSSPLTRALLRATGGTLADSITHYLTSTNVLLICASLMSALLWPLLVERLAWSPRRTRATACLGLALTALGPEACSRVNTNGLHRNALFALISTFAPRVEAQAISRDWRLSPFPPGRDAAAQDGAGRTAPIPGPDLSWLRGQAKGRNVILILLESAGARHVRLEAGPSDPTPNLTALAAQAIVFEQAHAVYPESIKGLLSVLCSRYPAFDTAPESAAHVRTPSLAEVLGREGYRTGLFHSGRFMYLGMEAVVHHRGFDTLEDAGDIGGNHESSFGVDEPATVRRVLSWIDAQPHAGPFFLCYLPIAGHHPYNTPEPGPFPERDDRGRYQNALHYGDAALGELLRGLEHRALLENTLFVIAGDHGEAFGEHEVNYGHTLFVYEENLHVPYLIAAPGLLRGQARVNQPASLVDTAPTVLDLLGASMPLDYQGVSLLEASPRVSLSFTDYSLGWLALQDGPWKYILELESGRSMLFDLGRDPLELVNLAGEQPLRVAAYREHAEAWSRAERARWLSQKGGDKLSPHRVGAGTARPRRRGRYRWMAR